MKDQYSVRSVKAIGTQWIDHKLCAIERLADKFGLYCQHIQHAIPEIKTQIIPPHCEANLRN